MSAWHSTGGKARAAKLSPERRKQIAALAANTRWGNRQPPADRDWLLVASKGRMRTMEPEREKS